MSTMRCRVALLASLAVLVQSGCGGRAGGQQSDQSLGGIAGFNCLPGDTRECVGPGACRGGQQCDTNGQWSACACGSSGGMASTASVGTGGLKNGGGTAGAGVTAGATSHANFGGTAGTGGRSQGGMSSRTGGSGGVVGGASNPTGGSGSGGVTHSGGVTAGGAPSGGAATGGMGGTGTGGTATGGTTNRPPQLTGLGFYPNPVTTNDTLYIYTYANDPDSDKITYAFAWTCNGKAVGTNSSQLSGALYFSKGDSVRVTVTPSDGKTTGNPVTSEAIIVANAPPLFGDWPSLSPSPYADNDATLSCNGSATDPDGDTVTYSYKWYDNEVLTSYSDSTLPSTATANSDYWDCEVVASDGSASVSGNRAGGTTIATTVSGIYRVDTTWQAAKSPYIVTGRIQVAAGVTLKIEPGVVVQGNSYSLESWGSVVMAGTADKPILITDLYASDYSTSDKPGAFTLTFVDYSWGALLSSGSTAHLDISDCVFEGLSSPIYLPWGSSTAHRVERNLFRGCCGIMAAGPLLLNTNTFTDTNGGYHDVEAQDSVIGTSNNFYPNYDVVVMAGAKAVDLRNCYWGGLTDAEIRDLILDNTTDLMIPGVVQYLPTLTAPSPDAPPTGKTYF